MRLIVLVSLLIAACGAGSEQVANGEVENRAGLTAIKTGSRTGESLPPTGNREINEQVATILNLNDLVCARVVSVTPLKDRANTYEVTCVEYRAGLRMVRYNVDASAGTAFSA